MVKSYFFPATPLNEMTNADKSILKIPFVDHEAAGLYECEADNGIIPTLKTNFTITIRGKN